MFRERKNSRFIASVVVGICCVALALSMVGCSGGSSSSSDSKSSTSGDSSSSSSATKLIVGFDNSYPPYGFVADDGSYTGFDLDLAKKVADNLGWEIELSAIDWSAKDALLESGSINCIWNGFTMEGREGKYAFTEPYMLNQQVIVVAKDSGITDVGELSGKTVLTQADSAALEVLQGDQKALADTFGSLDTIADYNNAFMQLEAGQVDAVACDLSIAQYQLSANPDKFVKMADALSSENYAVGFKNDSEGQKMADQVTEQLRALYNDGTVKELCDKYSEYGLSFDNWELK